eukprot:s458_g2.t1
MQRLHGEWLVILRCRASHWGLATCADFDQSNTGSISKDDLRKILHGGAVRGIWQAEKRKDQVDDLLGKVEAGGSGELSFDTFMELQNCKDLSLPPPQCTAKAACRLYTSDKATDGVDWLAHSAAVAACARGAAWHSAIALVSNASEWLPTPSHSAYASATAACDRAGLWAGRTDTGRDFPASDMMYWVSG